jgi:anaerobic selenocysteine-containing dehydrogenase
MEINRRDFFKVGVFSAGTLFAPRLWGDIAAETVAEQPWEGPPGQENEVLSVCQMCPNGCGIRVRIYEGRAIKIEGIPGHPLNNGSLCPRGQSALQLLYHPRRLAYPVLNKGARGKGGSQKMTREETVGLLAEKIGDLVSQRQTHRLVIVSGSHSDTDDLILRRFCDAVGTPNYLKIESLGRRSRSMAMGLTQGIFKPPSIDWSNCNFIMFFGAEPGNSDISPMWLLRGFGELRQGRAGRRAKIVHVSTHFSPFSSKVDDWIKINPGTYGALALGIANIIISEEKYDADFIEHFTLGFEQFKEVDGTLRPGFKEHVLENYEPAKVSSITGVPEATIIRLADEFSSNRPSVAYGGDGPASYSNAVTELVAIHSLNALIGSVDVPGGVLIQRDPPLRMPEKVSNNSLFSHNLNQPPVDNSIRSSNLPVYKAGSNLPMRLSDNSPYPVEVLVLVDYDPLEEAPGPNYWREAFKQIPFVVSFSNFSDETSRLCDLTIPPGTFLERWDGKSVDSSTGFPVWGLSRPVLETPLGGIDPASFFMKLSKSMGHQIASAFPWQSIEELLKEMAADLNPSPGQVNPWDEIAAKGYWSQGPYSFGRQREVYQTRGNRFNFFMYSLEAAGTHLRAAVYANGAKAGTDLAQTAFLPNHIPAEFENWDTRELFYLELFGTTLSGHGRHFSLEGLRELQELDLNRSWGLWLLVNPRTASKLNLSDNDAVWVESNHGKLPARVKKVEGISEDSVGMIFGQDKGTEHSHAISNSAMSLVGENISPLGGGLCWATTRVRILRA